MKRYFYLALFGAMFLMAMPARADWWPSEPYCKFIKEIHLDRTWAFNTSIVDDNAGGVQNSLSPLQEAPGYLCFSIVSWDNHCDEEDDYEMDWCQLELFDKSTTKYHQICYLDFIPEGNRGNDWVSLYNNEGNYNITTDERYYKNMNNCETRYCKKRLYRSWADGIMHCFFVTRYSPETRKFIEDAGDNLQVFLKGRWDNKHWRDFSEYSDWKPEPFISSPATPNDASVVGFVETDNGTQLRIQVPATTNGEVLTMVRIGNGTSSVESDVTRSAAGHIDFPVDGWMKTFQQLNDGEIRLSFFRSKDYSQSLSGYANPGYMMVPFHIKKYSETTTAIQVPQLRMARGLALSDDGQGMVKMTWEADPVTGGRTYSKADWIIERCTDNKFDANTTVVRRVAYKPTDRLVRYTDTIADRDNGLVTYYYRVRRDHAITTKSMFYIGANIRIQTDYAAINTFSAEPGAAYDEVRFSWNLSAGIWTTGSNGMRLELWRDGADIASSHVSEYHSNDTFTLGGIHPCEPHDYELRIYENSTLRSSRQISGFVLPDGTPSIVSDYRQSKGFYGDRVDISWKIAANGQNFDRFMLKRKVYGSTENYTTLAAAIEKRRNVLDYQYTDANVAPGTVYEYLLEGYVTCDTIESLVASQSGAGFALAYGTVSGQVLYENGQAVQDVVIDMSGEDTNRGNSLELQPEGYAVLDNAQAVFGELGGAAEMLVRLMPGKTGYRPLLYQADAFDFGVTEDEHLNFAMRHGAETYTVGASLAESEYWLRSQFNHVAYSYRQSGDTLQMAVYVNGHALRDTVITGLTNTGNVGASVAPLYLGCRGTDYLEGYIADLRLWNDYRSPLQIGNYHDCYLTGKEEHLSGYYHFDELLEDRTFDVSGDANRYHERHLRVVNGKTNSGQLPAPTQLGLRARTNDKGNYLINAVPYGKVGTLYNVTASYGTHQFKPATKAIFFDRTAATHNNADFTDISCFTVSGTITYAGGTYPAEGIMFKVDGIAQSDNKGNMVQTDAEGHFSLSVPVGVHNVQAFSEGHRLTNGGWITEIDGSPINYQHDYSGIHLEDSTRVRFVGRVCGGEVQKALPVGHTVSRNNLGQQSYVLLQHNHKDKYKLSTTTVVDSILHQTPSIYALDSLNPNRKAQPVMNRIETNEDGVRIYTNDSTGEFYADVYPIQYTMRISAPGHGKFNEDGEVISFVGMSEKTNTNVELRTYEDSVVARVLGDSLIYGSATQYMDTLYYSKKQVFCLRVSPTFVFTQVDASGADMPYYGVDSVSVSAMDTVYRMASFLPDADPDDVDERHYNLTLPLYTPNYSYRMRAKVCEIYPYYTEDGTTILRYDSVPTTDAVITINNSMAREAQTKMSVNSNGVALYSFSLRDPETATAQGQIAAVAQYNDNKNTISWVPPFRHEGLTYFTGSHKKGSDFITAGPNKLLTILRDPAGSTSYSYLEAGATFKEARTFNWDVTEDGKLGAQFVFGVDFNYFSGMGLYIHGMESATQTVTSGWQHSHAWSNSKTMESTITTTKRYSTSSSESFVGASADVFVGSATNYALGTAENVMMVDSATYRRGGSAKFSKTYAATPDSTFVLVKTDGMSVGQQFATEFVYTQSDIEKQEIPRLEQILDQLLMPYNQADSVSMQRQTNQDLEVRYMLRPGYSKGHADYGKRESYYRILPDANAIVKPDTTIVKKDSVATVYNWIQDWKFYLGLNEYQKYKAIANKKYLIQNFSIANGSTLTMSQKYSTNLSYSYTKKAGDYFYIKNGSTQKSEAGFYLGVDVNFEETVGTVATRGHSASQSYDHTCGFVLAPGVDERLSIDVLHDQDWSESKEKNLPEWKEDGADDKAPNSVTDVTANIQQPESYPSFIFYTRGGQTCCPYEPATESKYIADYLTQAIEAETDSTKRKALQDDLAAVTTKRPVLSESTLQVDKPALKALNTFVDGVPSGEEAYVKIEMSNASEGNTVRSYLLKLKNESNPDGAQFSVDGSVGLSSESGMEFRIPYGTTLQKTVAIRKGAVLDYDNLTLYLMAACGTNANKYAIKDSCTFSVHFTPACSGIAIKSPGNSWVYNTELDSAVNPLTGKTERYLPIELNEFDVNYDEFDHIELQYKPSFDSESQWRKLQYFYKDSTALKAAVAGGKDPQLVATCQGGVIHYRFFMDDLDDQEYDIRAVTFCRNGYEFVENYSDVVSGTKDTYRPRLFGAAKPANGILTIEDEIRLDFNEDIAGGKLTYNNFSVTGILDNTQSDHQVAVHLSGDGRLETELPLYLDEDYTLEGWFQQGAEGGEQELFSLGDYPYSVRLTLDKAAGMLTMYADTFSYTYRLEDKWKTGEWNHVAIVRQQYSATARMRLYLNCEEVISGNQRDVFLRSIKGLLKVGDGFVGNVDQVRLWDIPRDNVDLRTTGTNYISNTAVGLIACYNMDENQGTVLEDVSGGHTLQMLGECSWTVPAGKALHLDGETYAAIPMAEYSLTADQDYTLDFWFRTANKQDEAMLLSTGMTDSTVSRNSLQVLLNSRGRVMLTSGTAAKPILLTSSKIDYRDNKWHHVLFTVGRATGFARLYVDGSVAATATQDNVGGLAGSQLYVGAQPNYLSEEHRYTYAQAFTGEIDEVRLQNVYMTQFQVESFRMMKTDSTMLSLLFYYPFERYETSNIGISSMVYSLRNFCRGKSHEQVVVTGNADRAQSDEAAPVATGSPLTYFDQTGFTFTPSDQSVILTLTKPLAHIEHTILTFTANEVRDVHGNKMISPVRWSAYIDRNPLTVENTEIELRTQVMTPISYSLSIANRSGAFHNFTLSGAPTWMMFRSTTGTVAPNGTAVLSFRTDESLPVGTHTAHLYLTNSDDVVIPITVTVTVEGDAPAFDFDPKAYKYSMNIVGQICIDGVTSLDERDILAAFCDGKCVGMAHTAYYQNQDAYYVNLTVYCDTTSQRTITYLIYDASTGRTYAADCRSAVRTFISNSIIGSPASPAVFYNTGKEYRTYHLQPGWNWLSWNVKVDGGNTPANVLGTGWESGTLVKTYDAGIFFDYKAKEQKWSSSAEMDCRRLWTIYTEQPHTLLMSGTPIATNEVEISIVPGWNGIGYLPSISMTPREAFAGMRKVTNDDVIKSQTQFAIYFNGDWVGTLKSLQPGEGYMYLHRGDTTSFRYPRVLVNLGQAPERVPVQHETTMSIVAHPEGIVAFEGDVLKVYAGEELVGAAAMQDGVWYVSVAGEHSRVPLRFVCHTLHGSAVSLTEVDYNADAVLGSPAAPYTLVFEEMQPDEEGAADQPRRRDGVEKQIRNEQLIILRDEHIYNALGTRLQ